MKLKKLNLANYRGFEQIELEFGDLTVIAGVNGSGKSGILQAIATLLSKGASQISDSNDRALSFDDDDVRHGSDALSVSCELVGSIMYFGIQTVRSTLSTKKLLDITEEIKAVKDQQRNFEAGSRQAKEMADRLRVLDKMLQDPEDHVSFQQDRIVRDKEPHFDQPLFVFYKPSRLFGRLTRTRGMVVSERFSNPSKGHVGALSGGQISLNDFLLWFELIQQGKIGDGYIATNLLDSLNAVLKEILPEVSELELVTPNFKKVPFFTLAKADNRFRVTQLSDGEKIILALAFDLVRRLTLANPDLEEPTKEGHAIVLIDEIELHLHPTWQRRIVRRLRTAFPKCQFIMTTHSPQILSEVEAQDVRFLYRDDKTEVVKCYIPDEAFGLDANRMLDEMGTSERNPKVAKALNILFTLIDDEKFEEARKELKPLTKLLGELDPEITRAQALIAFLEDSEA